MKTLICLLFLFHCKVNHPKKAILTDLFRSKSSKSISVHLSYGKKIDNNETFSTYLSISNSKSFCLNSSSPTKTDFEFGIFLQICYPNASPYLKKAIQNWQKYPQNIIQASFYISDTEHAIISSSKLKEKIKLQKCKFALLGDHFLNKELSKSRIEQKKVLFRDFGASFGTAYFSFFVFEKEVWILYPAKPPLSNQKSYFSIKLNKSYKAKFTDFFQSIQTKNTNFLQNCKKQDPTLTEVFAYSTGPKRFLEMQNPHSEIICFSKITISAANKTFELKNQLGFLFPSAIVIFSESTFYESLITENIWSIFSKNQKIEIKGFHQSTLQLKNQNYSFENESFSNFFEKNLNCSQKNVIYEFSGEQFCGNPGISSPQKKNHTCKLQDFSLDELNLYGIEYREKLDSSQKFLEFSYQGNSFCDLSNFALSLSGEIIPLASSQKIIPKDSIFIIGGNLFFEKTTHFISRNLKSLNEKSKIHLVDQFSNETKKFFDNSYFLAYKNSQNQIFSLVRSNHSFVYYPFEKSKNLKPYIKKHKMSPNQKDDIKPAQGKVFFSEVAWMGAYEGTTSKPYDEFIEFFSNEDKNQTILFELKDSKNPTKTFLLPIAKGYNVLSKGNFDCFNVKDLQNSNFSLSGEDFTLSIKQALTSKQIDFLKVAKGKNQGINATIKSKKVRASYIFSQIKDFWLNSSFSQISPVLKPNCQNNTFASPKSANLFDPFFVSKLEKSTHIELDFFYSKKPNSSIKTKQYSIFPNISKSIELLVQKNYQIQPDAIFGNQSLVHLEFPTYQKLFFWNQSDLFISAINPSPPSSKNEWVQICNRSESENYDLTKFYFRDEDKRNRKTHLVSYNSRKPSIPSHFDKSKFTFDNTNLPPKYCAYVIRINHTNEIFLPHKGNLPMRILTSKVASASKRATSLFPSGLASSEKLDLYFENETKTIHIHSYGNRHSAFPFKIYLSKGKIAYLKENQQGNEAKDYEIR